MFSLFRRGVGFEGGVPGDDFGLDDFDEAFERACRDFARFAFLVGSGDIAFVDAVLSMVRLVGDVAVCLEAWVLVRCFARFEVYLLAARRDVYVLFSVFSRRPFAALEEVEERLDALDFERDFCDADVEWADRLVLGPAGFRASEFDLVRVVRLEGAVE